MNSMQPLMWKLVIYGGILLFIALSGWFAKRSAARRIARTLDESFQPDHVFKRARTGDYPWLTASFYDASQRQAEGAGLQWIADIEDETLSQVHPDKRTFVRILGTADGGTRAAIYEIVVGGPQGSPKQRIQTCELISELSDGTSHTTTTAPPNRLLTPPPGVFRHNDPPTTPIADMLASHEARIGQYLQWHPGVQAVPVRTYAEATAAWQAGIDRQRNRLKGGITREELVRIAPADRKDLASEVYDHMQKRRTP